MSKVTMVFVAVFWLVIGGNIFAATGFVTSGESRSIIVSIKPIHSLVMGVLEGTQNPPPILLLSGQTDPHDFSLTPFQVKELNRAALIFTISVEDFETNLANTLKTLPKSARVIRLLDTPNLKLLPNIECNLQHRGWHHHQLNSFDPHIWLSPDNGVALIKNISEILARWDRVQAARYRRNATLMIKKIRKLDEELRRELTINNKPSYLVFHNGYQYFQKHYRLKQAGCIFFDGSVPLSGQRLQKILDRIQKERIGCVFGEPHIEISALQGLLQSKNKTLVFGTLDPLGMELEPGPGCYFQILRNLADGYQKAFKVALTRRVQQE